MGFILQHFNTVGGGGRGLIGKGFYFFTKKGGWVSADMEIV